MQELDSLNRPARLAVLTSHPIQYQAPLYRLLAAQSDIDLTVFYCSDHGLTPYFDAGFGQAVQWDVPLTEGYHSVFLRNLSPKPDVSRFWGVLNPGIVPALLRGRYDALLVQGWMRSSFWIGMAAAWLCGIPVIMRGESNLLRPVTGWKAIVKRMLLKSLFRRTAAFLAIGKYNREFYRHYGVDGERILTAPYAVDNALFQQSAAIHLRRRDEIRRELGVSLDSVVILFTGKLCDSKRPLDLLEAFMRIPPELNAALVYVGEGELRPQIEERIRERRLRNVFLAGFQNQTQLPKFYALADIFVLPSTCAETWGLVVNEAMCTGLPVVVSDQVGSAGDLVREGYNGFTFEMGDVVELSNKLTHLVRDREAREKMGAASRQMISRWSFAENVEAIRECLSSIVDRNLRNSDESGADERRGYMQRPRAARQTQS
jgi:glycosyltransferase involved in cell wall biosynthesis